MSLETHAQRSEPAQSEVRVVRAHAKTQLRHRRSYRLVQRLRRRDRAHHDVGMAANIFRGRENRDVDAALERRKEVRRRPTVVQQRVNPARARGGANRRHVLDLERHRSRRLEKHESRVRAERPGDVGADERVIVARFDAEALERRVAEDTRRRVHCIGNEDVIAGPNECLNCHGDGSETGGEEHGAETALEGRYRLLERQCCRRRELSIANDVEAALWIAGGFPFRRR